MAAAGGDLKTAFNDFCDKGNEITTANVNKWMKKAGVTGKACSSQSIDIAFMKAKPKDNKKKKTLSLSEFKDFVKFMAPDYAKDVKKDAAEAETQMLEKLAATKNIAEGTKTSKTGNVDKFTDAKQYTGSHKERFGEDGKGKGIEGRADVVANDGYVGNYKGKDTFDKKH